jgi:hypothetical protein
MGRIGVLIVRGGEGAFERNKAVSTLRSATRSPKNRTRNAELTIPWLKETFIIVMKLKILAVALLCLAGCASGARFEKMVSVPSDKAVVYIYRPKQVMGWGGLVPVNSGWRLCPNGTDCVRLWQGGYCVNILSPGTNVFTASLESADGILAAGHSNEKLCVTNLEPAKVYFMKLTVGAFSSKLTPVDPAEGEKALVHYKLETP